MCDHFFVKRLIAGKARWICRYCGLHHKEYTMYYMNHFANADKKMEGEEVDG